MAHFLTIRHNAPTVTARKISGSFVSIVSRLVIPLILIAALVIETFAPSSNAFILLLLISLQCILYFIPVAIYPNNPLLKDVTSPYFMFLGPYIIVYCSESIRYLLLGTAFHSVLGLTDVNKLHIVLLQSLAGLVAFQVTFFITHSRSQPRKAFMPSIAQLKLGRLISFSSTLFLNFMLLILILGFSLLEMRRGQGQYEHGITYFMYVTICIFFTPALLANLYFNYKLNGRFFNLPLLVSFSVYIILQGLIGSRSNVIFPIIGVFICMRLIRSENIESVVKSKWMQALKAGVILVCIALFLIFITIGRAAEDRNPDSQLDLFLTAISMGHFEPNEIIATALNAFGPASGIVTELNSNLDHLFYGQTYLNSLINLALPSFIVPPDERLLSPSIWFHETYYASTTDLGVDFSLLAESFMNFGYGGIIIVMALMAFILKRLYLACFNKRDFSAYVLYANAILAGIWYLRSDSESLVKHLFYTLLFLATMRVCLKVIAPRK